MRLTAGMCTVLTDFLTQMTAYTHTHTHTHQLPLLQAFCCYTHSQVYGVSMCVQLVSISSPAEPCNTQTLHTSY